MGKMGWMKWFARIGILPILLLSYFDLRIIVHEFNLLSIYSFCLWTLPLLIFCLPPLIYYGFCKDRKI